MVNDNSPEITADPQPWEIDISLSLAGQLLKRTSQIIAEGADKAAIERYIRICRGYFNLCKQILKASKGVVFLGVEGDIVSIDLQTLGAKADYEVGSGRNDIVASAVSDGV